MSNNPNADIKTKLQAQYKRLLIESIILDAKNAVYILCGDIENDDQDAKYALDNKQVIIDFYDNFVLNELIAAGDIAPKITANRALGDVLSAIKGSPLMTGASGFNQYIKAVINDEVDFNDDDDDEYMKAIINGKVERL